MYKSLIADWEIYYALLDAVYCSFQAIFKQFLTCIIVKKIYVNCYLTFEQHSVKIPKIRPGTYIFQRPFLRGLFLEGLIFKGAYLWREICVSKSIGLALQLKANLPFLLRFTLYLREIFQGQALGGLKFGGAT